MLLRIQYIPFDEKSWLQCVLAAIIIVSLRGIFVQVTQLEFYFKRSASDTLVWFLTFWATVLLDVHLGLIVGAVLNVFILIGKKLMI